LLFILSAVCLTVAWASASESDRMPDIDSSQELSLTVTMTYTDPNLETDNVITMSGVEVRLVQVASLEVNGGSADYTLLEAYAGSGIELAGMTASESAKAAELLAALVVENESADVMTAATDLEGKAIFSGLEAGMYLVYQEESANSVYGVDAIVTMLISVPYPQTSTDGNSWIYAVETYPKTELSGPKNNGTITVTKELYNALTNLTYYSPEGEELVFYVGLFTDEACTQRAEGTTDLALTFVNSSSASATFENLTTDQTYYIAETDGNGNVISSVTRDGVVFEAAYPDGQAVTITGDGTDASIRFRNTTAGIPENYSYGGTLTITKKTVCGTEDYVATGTYYAGIFTDAAFTTLAGDVVELKLDNTSSVSVEVRLYFGTEASDSVTLYVTETDREGTPLSNDSDIGFMFSLSKEGGKVTLSNENSSDEIVITNSFEKTETETETESETESRQETETKSRSITIESDPDTEAESASNTEAMSGQEIESEFSQEIETESDQEIGTEYGPNTETEFNQSTETDSGQNTETETETEAQAAATSTPQTGDDTPLALTIAGMMTALIILLAPIRRIRNR